MPDQKRAAIYLRVSTKDKQTIENQMDPCLRLITERGWVHKLTYQDHESGASAERRDFLRLMRDAEHGEFDAVVVWSLDRFTREGTYRTLGYLEKLKAKGIGFVSVTEPYLDTLGAFSEVVLAMLAVIAKQERIRLCERVKAGMAIRRAAGVKFGRKEREINWAAYEELADVGWSISAIAGKLGVPVSTLHRRIKQKEQQDAVRQASEEMGTGRIQ